VLQHALGLDEYGRGEPYRNHYVAGTGHHSWDLLMSHVEAGRMVRHEPRAIFGGDSNYCFTVTEAGKQFVREQSPKPPKMTRSQRRYQAFLDADCGLSFGEWLKECTRG
jgi:hypothetical protein